MNTPKRGLVAALAALSLVAAACGGSSSSESSTATTATSGAAATTAGGAAATTAGGATATTAGGATPTTTKYSTDTTSGDSGAMVENKAPDKVKSVANVVNGYLGDAGFFDDAERGLKSLSGQGYKTNTLQADPNNTAQWKANLESVSTGDYDIVVVGTSQMTDLLKEASAKYPNQNYIFYDNVLEAPNVASIVYKQNEGSFLAGVLAALVTTDTTNFPMANADKKVGLVGGMDIPVINDFVAGFKAGVEAVDPDIEVVVSYVGNFTDSQKGYDLANTMYNQGADVVFQVAGGAGLGVLKASEDAKRYSIGVDANQNGEHPGFVLASMLKNIGVSLDQAVNKANVGALEFGKTTAYGLANDGVGLDFANNNDIVPAAVIEKVDEYKKQVVDGSITVPSVNG